MALIVTARLPSLTCPRKVLRLPSTPLRIPVALSMTLGKAGQNSFNGVVSHAVSSTITMQGMTNRQIGEATAIQCQHGDLHVNGGRAIPADHISCQLM
jgi:hypothetical protein